MAASKALMVRNYQQLASFFDLLNARIENVFYLEQKTKALLGCVLLTENLDGLHKFATNRYFIDAIGINTIPDLEQLELESCVDQLSDLARFLDGSFASNGVETALASSKHIYQLISGQSLTASMDDFWDDEKSEFFMENGYLVVENFMSVHECDLYRDEVYSIARRERETETAFLYGYENSGQRVYNLINKTRSFDGVLMDRRLSSILDNIFDRSTFHQLYVMSSWHANILSPGAKKQILHVDASVPEPLPPWIARLNVNFIVEDYNFENGATLCVPGSHNWLRKPTQEDIKKTSDQLVTLSAPKGSIVIWHGHLWHQSGHNQSSSDRMALLACYAASHLLEVAMEENHTSVIDAEQKQKMGSNLRNLFGLSHGIK